MTPPPDLTVDHDFFTQEISRWYRFSGKMGYQADAIICTADLPPLTEAVAHLGDMVPALNNARKDIGHNLFLGSEASDTIADLLVATAREYCVTEDEATELAGKWI